MLFDIIFLFQHTGMVEFVKKWRYHKISCNLVIHIIANFSLRFLGFWEPFEIVARSRVKGAQSKVPMNSVT